MQLIAEINFFSLKPGSDKTRVMCTRSNNEELTRVSVQEVIMKNL